MHSIAVPPSSVEGTKRLAKTLKRERSIFPRQAFEKAARIAGFENLRRAQHQLDEGARPTQAEAADELVSRVELLSDTSALEYV